MKSAIRSFDYVKFLNDDGFTPETYKDPKNRELFVELKKLKDGYIAFTQQIRGNTTIREILEADAKYLIRIQRLRLIIQPRFEFVMQKHLQGRNYAFIRSYWVDDNGNFCRIMAKSLGRTTEKKYKEMIKNPKFISRATKIMKEKLYKQYTPLP